MKKYIIYILKLEVLVIFLTAVTFAALHLIGEPIQFDVMWKTFVTVFLITLFSFIIAPVVQWWFELGE